jgi:hypothetical protein
VANGQKLFVVTEPIKTKGTFLPVSLWGTWLDCYCCFKVMCSVVDGEVGWGGVDWIGVARDKNSWRALVNSVLNLRVP